MRGWHSEQERASCAPAVAQLLKQPPNNPPSACTPCEGAMLGLRSAEHGSAPPRSQARGRCPQSEAPRRGSAWGAARGPCR